jgi:hypothetical protein
MKFKADGGYEFRGFAPIGVVEVWDAGIMRQKE